MSALSRTVMALLLAGASLWGLAGCNKTAEDTAVPEPTLNVENPQTEQPVDSAPATEEAAPAPAGDAPGEAPAAPAEAPAP